MERKLFVHLRENSKKPTGSRWEIGDEERKEVWLERGDNAGILTRENGIMILDFDEKPPAREFWKQHRSILSVCTETRRGIHFLFKHDGGEKSQKQKKLDIKRTGYCLTAGCHIDGFEYRAILSDWDKLSEAPKLIIPEIQKEVKSQIECVSMVDRIEQARRRLLKIQPPKEGERNAKFFYVACLLIQQWGLDPMTAWPLLLEFNSRANPPWDMSNERERQELFNKLLSAEAYKHKK